MPSLWVARTLSHSSVLKKRQPPPHLPFPVLLQEMVLISNLLYHQKGPPRGTYLATQNHKYTPRLSYLQMLDTPYLKSHVSSVSHVRLCDPMNCSTPGLPVHHQLPESTQTHVHRVSDAIQPSHPLSSASPSALNPSQH